MQVVWFTVILQGNVAFQGAIADTGLFSFAFFVGFGAGLTIPRYISSFVLQQIEPTLRPLSLTMAGFDVLVVMIGVVSVLVYFFFSVEHQGAVGVAARVGIWVLMITFGAAFGYTVMGRIALLAIRVEFLLDDWLWLIDPTAKRIGLF